MRRGDGGGRIVVNPADLRRASTRLKDISGHLKGTAGRLKHAPSPVTAPEVAAIPEAVQQLGATLDTLIPPLTTSAVELKSRAIWAEIADQLVAGVPLTSTQLADFVGGLKDGSLVAYAEPWQAELAGEWVGKTYASQYRNPNKLIELADILGGSGTNKYFAGAFITTFGPERLVDIPRVIQAMEYARPLSMSMGDPTAVFLERQLAIDIQRSGFELHRDPLGLLSTFAMTLAVATSAGQLSRQTEQAIARDADTWAMAQLLSDRTHMYGTEFLGDCFKSGVVDRIVAESKGLVSPEFYPLGYYHADGTAGVGLPLDPKALVLEAISRNPDAAVAAFTTKLDVEVLDDARTPHHYDSALRLLYDYGNWSTSASDGGVGFAHAYTAAVNELHNQHLGPRANVLTQQLVDETFHGRETIAPMTTALAADLSTHHMGDMFQSAGHNYGTDPDGGLPGWIDGEHYYLTKDQEITLFAKFGDNEQANKIFLDSAAGFEGDLIAKNTMQPPGPGVSLQWAHTVGAFNGIVMDANDLNATQHFDASNAKHSAVFLFVHTVMDFVPHPHGTGTVVDLIDHSTAPSIHALEWKNYDGKTLITNATHAAIIKGYYDNRVLDVQPPTDIVSGGRLIPYTSASGYTLIKWDDFIHSDKIDPTVRPAVEAADQGRDNVDFDFQGG